MHRWGSSTGNGAGCPALVADSAGNSQTLFVYERNSSLLIVSCRVDAACDNEPFENTRIYSWVSRNDGFAADCQLPQAVEAPALEHLFQIIWGFITHPISSMSGIT